DHGAFHQWNAPYRAERTQRREFGFPLTAARFYLTRVARSNGATMKHSIQDERYGRLFAGFIAAGSFIGIIPPLQLMLENGMSLIEALWKMLRPFTITTNLMIVIVFGSIAFRGAERVSALLVGAVMLAILLVGIIFNLVLGQIPQLNWWTFLGDSLHHHIAPVAVPLWWLIYAPHGRLPWHAPLVWALYPLAYSAYSLVRAEFEPDSALRYPYFFMNVEKLGWSGVLFNLAIIAAAFTAIGFLIVLLDRRLARSKEQSAETTDRKV
ncbi:Pr6Pr family membrane protein, partial [Aquidulcibacter sp.]|uniref:Pr6Pr family membrane protein n=1 Tax=Aquidulcibacter sp. TaxID=2052990 RepID=UPI0025BA6468